MEQTDWEGEDRSYRYPKIIEAESSDRAERPVVFKASGEDGKDNWADEVVAFLQDLCAKKIIKDWNQVAFLFRSVRNAEVVRFANDLEAAGIPVYATRSNMYFECSGALKRRTSTGFSSGIPYSKECRRFLEQTSSPSRFALSGQHGGY